MEWSIGVVVFSVFLYSVGKKEISEVVEEKVLDHLGSAGPYSQVLGWNKCSYSPLPPARFLLVYGQANETGAGHSFDQDPEARTVSAHPEVF